MNLAIPDVRTLEIHPPTFNYQMSCRRSFGAGQRSDLGAPLLKTAIRDAAALGYNFLSIAGEHSLFYSDLALLCREAHRMRMLTTLTTRAGMLSARRMKTLVPSIDLLGLRYEAGMGRNLDPVRGSGIPYALVFYLTPGNMGELESTAAFAAAHGAAMLHVQPVGELSDQVMATVWMMIECLRDLHRGELAIQLDVLNRYNLISSDGGLNSWMTRLNGDQRFLGEQVSPLVIEENGTVVPLRHGFPRSMALGSLRDATLVDMAAHWIHSRADAFCNLYRKVLREAAPFGDLHQLLAEEAGRGRARFLVAGGCR